ncbi:MAG: glycosyltransferase [bacterium]
MTDTPADDDGLLAKATARFLSRRVQHQRLRVAARQALPAVGDRADLRLHIEFAADAESLACATPWLAALQAQDRIAPDAAPALIPRLAVVILIVGSRGDVQPFLPIGQRLAQTHRVRLATHAEFRPMVEAAGLEFYPLAADPRELMEYMVRTGGRIVPTRLDQLVHDVPRKRAIIGELLESTWAACTKADPGHADAPPFIADAIIANPPSYGHLHCAEALCVPLHMMFTMPWTPTAAFPHPMTHLPPGPHHPVRNFLSYGVVSLLMWGGVADVANGFREHTLGLPRLSLGQGAALLDDNEVPFTYLFPERVIERPADWGAHIDLASFVFFDQGATYEPPQALADFLAAGPPPVYIGFGSCVVDDPPRLTRILFEALEKAGVRGVVSRGWAALGDAVPPPHVHLIGDTPHDWLFPRCQAVCHHGGAGTTAAGLRAGLATVVVPFFGDQFFWGDVVRRAGAGPTPIPIGELTSDGLAEAFRHCLQPDVAEHARAFGARLRETDGAGLAVDAFHRHLPLAAMRCATTPERLSTQYCELCGMRLCGACVALEHRDHPTHLYRYVDWSTRPPHTIGDVVRELVDDAASVLRVGLEEIGLMAPPRRDGVILDDDAVADDAPRNGPVRRRATRRAAN